MDMTTSYLYVLVLFFTAYVVSEVTTVFARVGETAVLPCELSSADGRAVHIKWRRKSQTVFERIGKGSYEDEGYQGRVVVPEENLRKGNCSLVLKKVRKSDAAVYNSYHFIYVRRKSANVLISTVQLQVIDETGRSSHRKWPFLGKTVVSSPYLATIVLFLLSWILLYLFCKKIVAF